MSVDGDQIRPESLIKCSGIGDQVMPESLIKCFRNLRSNAAGIGDHFAPEYTLPASFIKKQFNSVLRAITIGTEA